VHPRNIFKYSACIAEENFNSGGIHMKAANSWRYSSGKTSVSEKERYNIESAAGTNSMGIPINKKMETAAGVNISAVLPSH